MTEDGYPYPGGEGADRSSFPLENPFGDEEEPSQTGAGESDEVKDKQKEGEDKQKGDAKEAPSAGSKENTERILHMVVWPYRDPKVLSLAITSAKEACKGFPGPNAHACTWGADLRRYDAMTPRAYCVIAPSLEVFMLK